MLKRNIPLLITFGVFIVGYLFCLSQFPGFASARVFFNLLTDNAFIGIVAVGMTFVILSGGIDLSVGSVIAFTGVLLAKLIGTGCAMALVLVMGVRVRKTTIQIYMLSSTLAVLSGIVFSLYTSAGYALAAIVAVVIGGTLLIGGVGTVLGTFFGVLIQGLIQTYITFDGTLSSWWTKIVIGILLFAFIVLQKGLSAFWVAKRA